jgi:predicted dehydrogenase
MGKLKVLVVGCGNMGSSHARSYHKIPGFELVGLVSRTPNATRESLAIELGGIKQYNEFEPALYETKPDVVSINTYTDTHKDFAIKSIQAGAHIFIEKPIAETVEEALEIISLANKKNKKIVVGYILRHHPTWNKFIEIAKSLDKPLVMRMNLNQQSSKNKWEIHKNLMKTTSPIVDCGVHYVDIMCQMTNSKPIKVSAIGVRLTDEISEDMYNYGQLQVRFDDGSVGWYESGWGPMMSETAYFVKDVIGPKGSISIIEQKNDSSEIDHHTKTNKLLLHFQERNAKGEFVKKDLLIDTTDEPNHQELCDSEQKFLLKAISENLDLTSHLNDTVNSLKIVLAADESIRKGITISLD